MAEKLYINLFEDRQHALVISDHTEALVDESAALEDILRQEERWAGMERLRYLGTIIRHPDGELEESNLYRAAQRYARQMAASEGSPSLSCLMSW
jgi:hypothetical protein